jgi:hypothetical protein
MLGKLGEIPCEPMKEKQGEVAFGESIMDRQLHVLNETFIKTKWLLFIQLMQSMELMSIEYTAIRHYIWHLKSIRY